MRTPVVAVLLLLGPTLLGAQVAGPVVIDSTRMAQGDRYPTGEIFPLIGVHYNSATGPTAHVAVIRTDLSNIHGYGGWALSADVGTHGGKLGVGRAGGIPLLMGVLLRTSYLRTWGDGPLRPRQDYLGADLRLSIWVVTIGVSEHLRIHGDAPGDGSFLAWSAGVGF